MSAEEFDPVDVVARAKAALKGVTEGPWNRHDFGHQGESEPSSIVIYAGDKFDWQAICDGDFVLSTGAWDAGPDADAAFVVAARSLVPELVAEVERLRAVAAALDLVPEYARGWTAQNGERQHATPKATLNAALLSGSTIKVDPVEVRWCTPWGPM